MFENNSVFEILYSSIELAQYDLKRLYFFYWGWIEKNSKGRKCFFWPQEPSFSINVKVNVLFEMYMLHCQYWNCWRFFRIFKRHYTLKRKLSTDNTSNSQQPYYPSDLFAIFSNPICFTQIPRRSRRPLFSRSPGRRSGRPEGRHAVICRWYVPPAVFSSRGLVLRSHVERRTCDGLNGPVRRWGTRGCSNIRTVWMMHGAWWRLLPRNGVLYYFISDRVSSQMKNQLRYVQGGTF